MKFLARKCVQMKREQADKLCTAVVGGRLIGGGTGMRAFNATQIDTEQRSSPVRALHRTTTPYTQVVLSSARAEPALTSPAGPGCLNPRTSAPLCAAVLLKHTSFVLIHMHYHFLFWKDQPAGQQSECKAVSE